MLAQSLWQFWPKVVGASERDLVSIEGYRTVSNIDAIAEAYDKKYPSDHIPLATAYKCFNDVGAARHRLRYYHLRFMAEYVGMPVGLLMLFSQFISVERRASKNGLNKRERILRLVSQIERFAAAIRRHVESFPATDGEVDFFITRHDSSSKAGKKGQEYLANLQVLKVLRDEVLAVDEAGLEAAPNGKVIE